MRFLPATTLPELSLDCLNSFQILQIIQNFLPNELRTFFKEKLKIFELSFLARKDILKLLTANWNIRKVDLESIYGRPDLRKADLFFEVCLSLFSWSSWILQIKDNLQKHIFFHKWTLGTINSFGSLKIKPNKNTFPI